MLTNQKQRAKLDAAYVRTNLRRVFQQIAASPVPNSSHVPGSGTSPLHLRWCRRDLPSLLLVGAPPVAPLLLLPNAANARQRRRSRSEPMFHCRTDQTFPTAEPVRIPAMADGSTRRFERSRRTCEALSQSRDARARRTLPPEAPTTKSACCGTSSTRFPQRERAVILPSVISDFTSLERHSAPAPENSVADAIRNKNQTRPIHSLDAGMIEIEILHSEPRPRDHVPPPISVRDLPVLRRARSNMGTPDAAPSGATIPAA